MRSWLLSFALLAVLLSGCAREAPAPQPGQTVTLTGTLIDTHCYADDHRNVGGDHERPQGHVPGCAALCARQGFPVGLLVDGAPGGAVWVLVTTPAVLADYMARTVRVTGDQRQGVFPAHVDSFNNLTLISRRHDSNMRP